MADGANGVDMDLVLEAVEQEFNLRQENVIVQRKLICAFKKMQIINIFFS